MIKDNATRLIMVCNECKEENLMYALSKESSYLRRSLIINDRNSLVNSVVSPVSHEERIKNELRDVGLSKV